MCKQNQADCSYKNGLCRLKAEVTRSSLDFEGLGTQIFVAPGQISFLLTKSSFPESKTYMCLSF